MDTNSVIKQAIEMIKKGDKANARTLLEDFVKNEPNNEDAWFLLAHVAPTQEQAETYLKRVLKINSNNEKAKQRLDKLQATAEKRQNVAQPANIKENNTVLHFFLGGIIVLLLAIALLLGGIWAQSKANINNVDVAPIIVTSVPLPSDTETKLIEEWEYMEIAIACITNSTTGVLEYCSDPSDFSKKYPSRVYALDELGQKGWEVVYIDDSDLYVTYFGLKRPLIQK